MFKHTQSLIVRLLSACAMLGLFLVINPASYAKTLLCPATNAIPDRHDWQCYPGGPGVCNGKAKFIGAALRDITDKEHHHYIRYVCLYQAPTEFGDSMVYIHKPKKLSGKKLMGKWFKGKGQLKFYCHAADPKDCPIPAFKK